MTLEEYCKKLENDGYIILQISDFPPFISKKFGGDCVHIMYTEKKEGFHPLLSNYITHYEYLRISKNEGGE